MIMSDTERKMSEIIFPLTKEEIHCRSFYYSEQRDRVYDHPLKISEYESLPNDLRLLDDTIRKYHDKSDGDFYILHPVENEETENRIMMIRSGRYAYPYLHAHQFIEIIYVYQGSCRQYIEGECMDLSMGSLCIISAETVHAIETNHDDDITFTFLVDPAFFGVSFINLLRNGRLIWDFFNSILNNKNISRYILYPTGNDPWMHNLILHMYQETQKKRYLYSEGMIAGMQQVFIHLLQNYEMDAIIADIKGHGMQENVVALMSFLAVNYNHITLHSTAEFFGYSEIYLGQLIKKITGASFSSIICRLQMDHAAEMLLNSNLSLTEIAQKIGCYDSSHFTRKFKKYYGMTPGKYRKNRKEI